jgi:hypothetical protein
MVAVVLICLVVSNAQRRKPGDPSWGPGDHPWQYDNVCWEDEKSQLNLFAQILKNEESSVGYIVVYAGHISCPGEAKYRAERARNWVLKRGIKSDRVIAMNGGHRIEVQTVLHLQDKAEPAYEPYPMLNKEAITIKKRCVDKVFARALCPNK